MPIQSFRGKILGVVDLSPNHTLIFSDSHSGAIAESIRKNCS